jgi:hypothetical protein
MNLWARSIFVGLISVVGLFPNFPNQETAIPYNAPDGLSACLKARPELEINMSINPYYISGDFDGDGFTDIAVQVKTSRDQRQGILLCFAKRDSALRGADNPLPWKDVLPFDDWMLIRKGSKRLSIYPELKFDTLAWFNGDGRGVFLYWDGNKFDWKGARIFSEGLSGAATH